MARRVRAFLDGPLADIVIRHRHVIVLLTLLNFVVMSFLASRIRSPEEATQVFPPDYPRMRYQSAEFGFASGQFIDTIPISFAFGAIPYASISRRDPAQKRVGAVHFDPEFDLSDPASQTWMLSFCRALSSPDLASKVRSGSQRCAMAAFDDWLRRRVKKKSKSSSTNNNNNNNNNTDDDDESLPLSRELFQAHLGEWLEIGRTTGSHDYYIDFYFRENTTSPAYHLAHVMSPKRWKQDLSLVRRERTFWREWMANRMASAPPGGTMSSGYQISDVWQYVETFDEIRSAAATNLAASLALAFLVLLLSTCDVVVSTIAASCIGSVVATVLGCMYIRGWSFGIIESICTTVLVGLSVDYTVHIANAYVNCCDEGGPGMTLTRRDGGFGGDGGEEEEEREAWRRIRIALRRMGLSVISGAVTTVGAASFLLGCVITFFDTFGEFICVTLVAALVHALVVFPAMCACLPSPPPPPSTPPSPPQAYDRWSRKADDGNGKKKTMASRWMSAWKSRGGRGRGDGWMMMEMSSTV